MSTSLLFRIKRFFARLKHSVYAVYLYGFNPFTSEAHTLPVFRRTSRIDYYNTV